MGESNIDFVSRIRGTLTQVSMERKSLDGAVVAPHRRDTDVNILSDLIDLPVYKEPCGENEHNTVDSTSLKALTNSDKRNGDVSGPLMNDKVVQTKTTIPNKPNNRGSKVGRHPSSSKADSLKSTTANLVRKTVADSSLQCSLIGKESCRGSKESAEVCFHIMQSHENHLVSHSHLVKGINGDETGAQKCNEAKGHYCCKRKPSLVQVQSDECIQYKEIYQVSELSIAYSDVHCSCKDQSKQHSAPPQAIEAQEQSYCETRQPSR